jgi:hypothetical protein
MVALELVTSLFGAFVGHRLFHLYNMLGNPYGRFLIFKRAVKLAIMGKVTDLIVPSFKRIDAFLREWNIGESDKRDLYLSATNILKDQKGYDLAFPHVFHLFCLYLYIIFEC